MRMLADKVLCTMFCHVSFSDKTFQVSVTAVGEKQIVVSPSLPVLALTTSALILI